MRPPPLFLLQCCSFFVCSGNMLSIMMATTMCTAHQWEPWQIGLGVTLANGSYASMVAFGGWLAERIGRARAGMIGGVVGAFGCSLPLLFAHPIAGVFAGMLGFAGAALYFPGCAGLSADSQGAADRPALSLHRKVSIYNMGWSLGALSGFAGLGLLKGLPTSVGFVICVAEFLIVAMVMARWRNYPASPVRPSGDRADHPALPRMTLLGRMNLLISATIGMGTIAVAERTLSYTHPAEARTFASLILTSYACGYVGMFVLLGRWSGWVMKPWRLGLITTGSLVSGVLLACVGPMGFVSGGSLALAGVAMGVAFGASYNSSIYYSLRLPTGASRAAGLHETFIGAGNTLGPIVAGAFIDMLRMISGNAIPALPALAIFVLVFSIALMGWQFAMIPGAAKLGAK